MMIFLMVAQVLQPGDPRLLVPIGNPADWVSFNDYPAAAIARGAQGTSKIQLTVARSGVPERCDVVETSADADLDATACRILMERARFKPNPAGGTIARRIVWRIPSGGLPPGSTPGQRFTPTEPLEITTTRFPDTDIEVEIIIDGTGHVEQCKVVKGPSIPGPDPCQSTAVGAKIGVGHLRNGKPVRAAITRKFWASTKFID